MSKQEEAADMRRAAEVRRKTGVAEEDYSNLQRVVHELQVHKIELEAQNDELHQARIERAAALDHYMELYDFAPIGYLTLSGDGLIEEINLTGATLLGVARGNLINKRFTSFVVHEDQELWTRFLADVKSHDAQGHTELVLQRGDGTTFHAQMDCVRHKVGAGGTAIHRAGSAFEVNIAMTDITLRKSAEAELYEALLAAEKSNLAKSDFLSCMSHELRTPLNAILGFTQLMESATPPPTDCQQRNLERILKAGWYLLELINEILDLSLIESGKAMLLLEPVSLDSIMLECQAMIEPQAQARSIDISRLQVTPPPYLVNADRTRLKQALINLLFNAIKYNSVGGSIDVEFTQRPPDSIRVSIRDTGPGLSAEQMAQLYQPFNRLGRECGAEEGTGIGLVVTKRLVELMGGTIGADSTVGVGSVFWIELRRASAPQPAVADDGQAQEAQRPDGVPLRALLLYVEDDPASLELVEQLIVRRPHIRLLTAADGDLGIEYARAYQPEVILMDINLPGLNGTDAMKILREDPATAHIPVIALSANAMPRDIEQGLAAGFFRYLTKPIKVTQFMDTLDVALQFAHAAAAVAARREQPR